MRSDFAVQFIQGIEDLPEHFVAPRRQTVDARGFRALGLGRPQPPALRHPRQHRIQRARTQAIAVMVQLFEHPLPVDAVFIRVVEDVDLPEGEQELAHDWIAHGRSIITFQIRNRFSITSMKHAATLSQLRQARKAPAITSRAEEPRPHNGAFPFKVLAEVATLPVSFR